MDRVAIVVDKEDKSSKRVGTPPLSRQSSEPRYCIIVDSPAGPRVVVGPASVLPMPSRSLEDVDVTWARIALTGGRGGRKNFFSAPGDTTELGDANVRQERENRIT